MVAGRNDMTITEAQTAVLAMLDECGLSRVIITQDNTHNRYSKRGDNMSYAFADLAELAEKLKPAPKMVQGELL